METSVDIPCPKCKREFKQDLKHMKPNAVRQCPHCGARIEFTGDDASKIAETIKKTEEDLKRSIDEINRRMRGR